MVKVLRPFHDAPSQRYVRAGDEIYPTPNRHAELAANGLVEPPDTETKAAPDAQNKMAEAPANKAVTATAKRRPGRPPGAKSRSR